MRCFRLILRGLHDVLPNRLELLGCLSVMQAHVSSWDPLTQLVVIIVQISGGVVEKVVLGAESDECLGDGANGGELGPVFAVDDVDVLAFCIGDWLFTYSRLDAAR